MGVALASYPKSFILKKLILICLKRWQKNDHDLFIIHPSSFIIL